MLKIKSKAFKFLIGTFAAMVLLVGVNAMAADFGPLTLKVGSKGPYVMAVQTLVGATVDGSFGPMTKAKVMAWQANNGLTADGVFGPASKAKAGGSVSGNFPAGCTSASGYSSTTGKACMALTSTPQVAGCAAGALYSSLTGKACAVSSSLQGGVGSLSYSATSGIGNEEVGEGEEDVKVAGLKLDATDSDSDVSVTAVKLKFARGGAAVGTDFEDVASEVSLWLGDTEVGRVDADVFNDDNDEEKTVTLSGAIVKMDTKEDLYVKVSGATNIDGTDLSDTWTVDFTQVRFVDGQAAVTTENVTYAAETFTFESYATSTDVELVVALKSGETDINEAHVINVDDTDDTTNEPILAFTLKAKGDSDVTVKEIPVLVTVATAANVDDVITDVELFHGSTSVASESITSTTGTTELVTFEDLDITIDAGDTETFYVKATFLSIADALAAGDTIKAEITGTEVDLVVAEDESGEDLVVADLTGTALGEASEVRDIGITLKLVSVSATKTAGDAGASTPTSDEADYSIVFDVTAFDGDVWVDKTAPDETGTNTSQVSDNGDGTFVGTITSANTLTGTNGYKVEEGTTERFTISGHTLATTSGYFKLSITDIMYALTDANGDVAYSFDLDTFKTGQLYLTDR